MRGRVLTIAGSDSGGGAGIQADIKSVTAMGAFAATAITALTAQDTQGVRAVHPVPLDFLRLQIAMSYGGRWDIVQAAQELARQCSSGSIRPADIDETRFAAQMQLADVPEVDLMIRTGGEQRISNFLLWHAAYAELFFSPVLWPEFQVSELEAALEFFASRERRFGLTHEQLPGRAG